jgi:hypothetical protein
VIEFNKQKFGLVPLLPLRLIDLACSEIEQTNPSSVGRSLCVRASVKGNRMSVIKLRLQKPGGGIKCFFISTWTGGKKLVQVWGAINLDFMQLS